LTHGTLGTFATERQINEQAGCGGTYRRAVRSGRLVFVWVYDAVAQDRRCSSWLGIDTRSGFSGPLFKVNGSISPVHAQDSKAEIEGGNYSIRLAGNTDIIITQIDDAMAQFAIGQGAARFSVYQVPSGTKFEADTPNAAMTTVTAGKFRIDVAPEGDRTRVSVNSGILEVAGESAAQTLEAG
jgi:hypothetical protein